VKDIKAAFSLHGVPCSALPCLKLGDREWLQYRTLQNRAGVAEKEEGNRDPFTSFLNTLKCSVKSTNKLFKIKEMSNSVSKHNKHHSLRFNCLKILVSFTGLALIPTAIKYILYGRKKHSRMAPSAPIERTFQQQSNVWAGFQTT